jgi:hypothetical protein
MRRRIAVVNDVLSSGGHVLDYSQDGGFTFGSHKVALIGGLAHCEACASDGTIAKASGPKRLGFGGMREVALDKDIVNCRCPVPPTISASLAGDSYCDDEVERLGAVSGAGYGGAVAAAVAMADVGGTADQLTVQKPDPSTPLSEAQPYQFKADALRGSGDQLAARGVSEQDEAECHAKYEQDMETCNAGRALYNSPAYFRACAERAFQRYQQCRGY